MNPSLRILYQLLFEFTGKKIKIFLFQFQHKKEHFITVNSNDKWYYLKFEKWYYIFLQIIGNRKYPISRLYHIA